MLDKIKVDNEIVIWDGDYWYLRKVAFVYSDRIVDEFLTSFNISDGVEISNKVKYNPEIAYHPEQIISKTAIQCYKESRGINNEVY